MSTVTPFAEGQLAYTSGRKADKNPYPLHSKYWVRWNSGWVSAQMDALRAAAKAQREAIEARPLDAWVTAQEEVK